jgi:hypothetical protein
MVTILEIAAAMGVTRQAAHHRALSEGWPTKASGTRAKQYVFDALPADVRAALADPGEQDARYATLKKSERRGRHMQKRARSCLSDEDFRLLLGKIKQVLGVRSDVGVARALGYSQSFLSAAKKKKQIPSSWLIQVAQDKGVSLDWLVFGVAPANRTASTPVGKHAVPPGTPEQEASMDVRQRLQALRSTVQMLAEEIDRIEGLLSRSVHTEGEP